MTLRIFLFAIASLLMLTYGYGYPERGCDDTDDHPICATNGVTYLNMCEFYRAKRIYRYIEPEHNGPCVCTAQEKFDWDPICATNTDSYANYCEYQRAKTYMHDLQIRHRNLCDEFVKRHVLSFRELQKLTKWKKFMPRELYQDFIKRPVYMENGKLMEY